MKNKKILIGFFPVLHDGYFSLLDKEDWEVVFWLPEEVLEKYERFVNLKRDLRWSDLSKIPGVVSDSGLVKNIKKITEEEIENILKSDFEIFMPDEDVSLWFAEKYLPNVDINYERVFLRRDFTHVTKEDFVDPDAVITQAALHREFMNKAEGLKDKSPDWWRQVGAVAVSDGKIIYSACNHGVPTDFGTALFCDPRSQFDAGENMEIWSCIHAESSIVAQASSRNDVSLRGADIYVTIFPCPVCAKLLSETGVKRVFYRDGYSKGEGKEVLKAVGIELIKVVR